ncbi:MAG: hypothetical protein ACE5R6_15910 [Candidatus Heimdallarchaeota archaeon]
MFVKVYRYRIPPEKTDKVLAIQRRVDQLYKKHIHYRVVILRSKKDPNLWLEIHWYPNEESYRHGMELINAEPMVCQLWHEFQPNLDPNDSTIYEEYYEQLWFEDSLSTK